MPPPDLLCPGLVPFLFPTRPILGSGLRRSTALGRKADEIDALTETWKQIAGGRIVENEVSYRQAVRILAQRLATLVQPGDDKHPYVQAMLQQGYRRATAYQVVNTAFERAAERIAHAGSPPRVAAPTMSAPPPVTPMPSAPVTAPAPVPRYTSTPVTPKPTQPDTRERYRADALPPHITPGMALPTAQDGGRVWIDCLPFEAHRDAPFGVDAHGLPWAPYGRDAEGRFRNYLGAALGVAGRTGRGHFVGEPDEP